MGNTINAVKKISSRLFIIIFAAIVILIGAPRVHADIWPDVGKATAGIIVENQGGTVKLISKKDADVYIGGYLEAAAIAIIAIVLFGRRKGMD